MRAGAPWTAIGSVTRRFVRVRASPSNDATQFARDAVTQRGRATFLLLYKESEVRRRLAGTREGYCDDFHHKSGSACHLVPINSYFFLLEFTEAAARGSQAAPARPLRVSAPRTAQPAQTQSMINPQKHQNAGGRLFGLPWHILSSRKKIK